MRQKRTKLFLVSQRIDFMGLLHTWSFDRTIETKPNFKRITTAQHWLTKMSWHMFKRSTFIITYFTFMEIYDNETLYVHSSEIRGLCLMKWPREMLQNLSYFWNTKTHVVFFVTNFAMCRWWNFISAFNF